MFIQFTQDGPVAPQDLVSAINQKLGIPFETVYISCAHGGDTSTKHNVIKLQSPFVNLQPGTGSLTHTDLSDTTHEWLHALIDQ